MNTSTTTHAIQKHLLRWFQKNQRDLPWRRGYNPYPVWISEVMLQQTQVKTVLPFYERWMSRFPDIRSVAEAPEDTVLKHWEGLGYYCRARNIQRTARILIREYHGEVPTSYKALRDLPGIGPYTAAAILSLAFNQDYPVVDGNVKRVFARLFDIRSALRERRSLRFIEETARAILPKGNARNFNQAIMELGAVVCTPRNPLCPACPIGKECRSRILGVAAQRPVPSPPKSSTSLQVAVGLLISNEKIFIQKRPPGGLMPGLWEFPGGKVRAGETPEDALVREFLEELEVRVGDLRKISVIRHNYTSFRVDLHAYTCRLAGRGQRPVLRTATAGRWVTRDEINRFPFPAANQKLIRMLQEHGHALGMGAKDPSSSG